MKVKIKYCPHHSKTITWNDDEGTCPECEEKWHPIEIPIPPNPPPPLADSRGEQTVG